MSSRTRLFLFVLLTLPFLVGIGGAAYQVVSTRLDTARHPAPGQMVDVGGHRLHLVCEGQGSPVVIMDAGLGDSWLTWSKTQPEIATRTRACSYDRAGFGYSEPGPYPRDSRQIVTELHALLNAAQLPPPYILVGHSFGGYNTRLYASTYPSEVAGLVLVDASHEDQSRLFPDGMKALWAAYAGTVRWQVRLATIGIERVRGIPAYDPPSVPVEMEEMAEPIGYRTDWYRTTLAEFETFPTLSADEVRAARRPVDFPLVVVTGSSTMAKDLVASGLSQADADSAARVWRYLQDDEATLSSRSHHVIADRSSHYVNMDQPELVIAAVDTVLAEIGNAPASH
jgi:pimeloyl-ACP methyl ester carboxylesterase